MNRTLAISNSVTRIGVLGSLLVLAACATSQPRTEVTRFHLGAPITAEPVIVRAAAGENAESIEYLTYAQDVSDELTGLGFTPVSDDSADLVAEIAVRRGLRPKAPKSSGMSIGIGGASRGGNVGIGGGLSIPIGGSKGEDVYVTEIKVSLIRLSTKAVVWEGTAVNEMPAAPANPAQLMRQITADLFADFPGESGTTTTSEPPTEG